MAKKKKGKSNFDDFQIDDDFDFDFEDSGIEPAKDDRKAITRMTSGFFHGVKEQTKSTSFYKNILKKALPADYVEGLESIEGAFDKGADLYNTSVSKLAPSVRAIKKQTRKILPSSEKIIPKALQDKLRSWAEDDYEGEGAGYSKDQQREAQIGVELGGMFSTQIEENAKQFDDAKRRDVLKTVIEGKRHSQSLDALDVIRSGISRMVGYQDNITIKYQRKSLELQFRHLYATRDLIEVFTEKSNRNLDALQGILKNTGLPDAIKLKNHEAFGNIARERFIQKFQGSAFTGLDAVVERITKNAKRMLGEKIDSFNNTIDQIANMSDTVGDAGLDPATTAGNAAGGEAANIAGGYLAGPLGRLLQRNPKLASFLARGSSAIKNATGHADAFAESQTNVDTSTVKGRAQGYILDTLKELMRDDKKANIGAGDMSESASDATSFTVLTRRSITDVIPGFLSRILREVTILRTGDTKTPLLTYNLHRQSFSKSQNTRDNFLDRIKAKQGIVTRKKQAGTLLTAAVDEQVSSTGDYVNNTVKQIDVNNKLSPQAQMALKRQLLHNAMKGKGFIPKQMTKQEHYDPSISDGQRAELINFFNSEFKANQDRRLGEDLHLDIRENEVSSNFKYLAQNVPAIIDEIELILKLPEGREHLEFLGFLKYKDGVSWLNYNAIIDFLISGSTGGSGGSGSTGGSGGSGGPTPTNLLNIFDNNGGSNATNSSSTSQGGNSSGPAPYRYARRRPSFTLGGNASRTSTASKRSSPIDTFRDLVGRAYSQGTEFKERAGKKVSDLGRSAKGIYDNRNDYLDPLANKAGEVAGNAKTQAEDYAEYLRYQATLARGEVGKYTGFMARAKDKAADGVEHARYQAALAKGFVKGRAPEVTEKYGSIKDRIEGMAKNTTNNVRNVAPGVVDSFLDNIQTIAGSIKARSSALFGSTRDAITQRVDGISTPEETMESNMVNAYVDAMKAQGKRVSFAGLRDWMQGARKLASDKLNTNFNFGGFKSFKFGSKTEMGGGGEGGNGSNPESALSDYENQMLELFKQNNTTLEEMKELMQANIHLMANQGGGDGRRFGFRYGLRSGIGKLLSGFGGLVGGGMKLYGRSIAGLGSVVKGAGSAAAGLLSKVGLGIRRYSDIYVRGNPNPVIFAKGIKEGRYTDVITQKKIRTLKDIKGPVVDDLGNQVITLEDFEKGLYDTQKKPILNRILNGALGFYGKMLTPFTTAAGIVVNVMKFAAKQFSKQKDIYVKGEPLPRLRVSIMTTGGYFSQRTKKPILSIKDIDGPVVDRDGNLILSNADIHQGLVDVNGRDIKTLGEKLWNVGSKVLGFGFGLAKSLVKMSWGLGKGALKLAKNLGIKSYNFLARGLGLTQVEAVTLTNSSNTVSLLAEIRDILDKRLPQSKKSVFGDTDGDGDAENSVMDKLRRNKAKRESEAAAKAAGATKSAGLFGGLGAKLKGLFGKGEGDEEEEGDTNIIGGIGGGDNDGRRRRGPQRPMGRMGRAWEKVKGVGRKIPGARFLGKAGSFLGRGLMGAGRIGVGLLGLGALGGLGIGSAIAGAGTALVAGAGAVLGGIAALLASPVVLGALAVTAIGVGGYYAYKYLSGANNAEFRNIRLAQYGIDPTNEEQAGKALELESGVEGFVSLNGATATLKMSAEDIFKVLQKFGVNTEDASAVQSWVTWFNERFKEVYIMHRAACEKTVPGSTLKQMDAKWNASQKTEALKLVRQEADYAPYNVTNSPFVGRLTGSRQIIAQMFEAAEKAFATANKGNDKPSAGPSMVAMGMGLGSNNAPKVALQQDAAKPTPVEVRQLVNKAVVGSVYGISGSITATGTSSGLSSRNSAPTALDSVRLKAYGLVNLDIDKVRVLRDLEREMIRELTFDPKGVASFSGDAQDYLNKYSSMFGISASNTKMVSDWTVWFSVRFMPVLVGYATAVREQNKTVDILDAYQYLKPDQLQNIAQSIVATKTGGFFSSSVWGIPHSPWEGYVLNNDSSSTKGNLEAISQMVKNREYADSIAATRTLTSVMAAAKPAETNTGSILLTPAGTGDKPASIFSTVSNNIINAKTPPRNMVEKAVEGQDSSKFGNSTYMMPVSGRISSSFGMRDHPISGEEKEHKGVDIAAPNGTPIRAAADGIIIVRGPLQGYGNAIYIKHPDGKSTRYAHMSSFQNGYSVGSEVKKGAIIGYVGSTGGSTGNHLHFEVRETAAYDAKAIDPIKFLGDAKAQEEVKELKGYETAAANTDTGGDVNTDGAAGGTGDSGMGDSPVSKMDISNSFKVLSATSPANSLVNNGSASAEDGTKAELEAKQQRAEATQAKAIEARNKAENDRIAVDISSVVEVLNRSYDVQVEMRDGIAAVKTAIESMGSTDATSDEAPTATKKSGKRPTVVPPTALKPSPVSMRKANY